MASEEKGVCGKVFGEWVFGERVFGESVFCDDDAIASSTLHNIYVNAKYDLFRIDRM